MRPRLLIVDDESLLRDLLYDFFVRQAYDVALAAEGNQAISLHEKESFNLALVDIKIPGLSGLEITRRLKKINPSIVVIIMTGYPSLNSAVDAIKSGASEYIVKPFKLEELNELIIKHLKKQSLELENMQLKQRVDELESKLQNRDIEQVTSTNSDKENLLPEKRIRNLEASQRVSNPIDHYKNESKNISSSDIERQLLELRTLLLNNDITQSEYEKRLLELKTNNEEI
jgi:DNA-binding NtrC family response regulator